MATSRGYTLYKFYLDLKGHFNHRKHIFSHGARTKASSTAYSKRRDVRFFELIARNINSEETQVQFLISCFLKNKQFWIGSALEEEYVTEHKERIQRVKTLPYLFKKDIEKIADIDQISIKKLLTTADDDPIIFRLLQRKEIILETAAVFDYFFKYTSLPGSINPNWEEKKKSIYKYRLLLEIKSDLATYKKTIDDLINSIS